MNPSFKQIYGKKIYCDSDGVLADFDKFVEQTIGLPFNKRWNELPMNTFLRLEKMPGADKLIHFLKQNFGKNLFVLTGRPKKDRNISENAKRDKRIWLNRNFQISFKNIFVCYKEQKYRFAQNDKNNILIDDTQRNVEEWIQAGGTGIFYQNADQTINDLQKIIKGV
jgi:hypothetical protein